jgi:hypothetical protein
MSVHFENAVAITAIVGYFIFEIFFLMGMFLGTVKCWGRPQVVSSSGQLPAIFAGTIPNQFENCARGYQEHSKRFDIMKVARIYESFEICLSHSIYDVMAATFAIREFS